LWSKSEIPDVIVGGYISVTSVFKQLLSLLAWTLNYIMEVIILINFCFKLYIFEVQRVHWSLCRFPTSNNFKFLVPRKHYGGFRCVRKQWNQNHILNQQDTRHHTQDVTYLQHWSSFPLWPATIFAQFKGHNIKCHCSVTAVSTLEESLECIYRSECVWFWLTQLWGTKGCIIALKKKNKGNIFKK